MTQPTPKRSSLALRIAKYSFYVAVVGFFVWYLRDFDFSALRDVEITWWAVALAFIPTVTFRFVGVAIWRRILGLLGVTTFPPFPVLARIFARAWMGRYIPGKVAWIAGKVVLGAEYGISKSKLAVSSLFEAVSQVVGVGLVSLLLLTIDGRIREVSETLWVLALLGAVALVVVMIPPVFNACVGLAFRILKRGERVHLSWRAIGVAVPTYGAASLLPGVSNSLLVFAVAGALSPRDILFVVGAFGLAAIVGMIAPFAPGGLGVRDVIQLVLLPVIVTAPVALVIVVVSRVVAVATDLVFLGLAEALHRFARPAAPAASAPGKG